MSATVFSVLFPQHAHAAPSGVELTDLSRLDRLHRVLHRVLTCEAEKLVRGLGAEVKSAGGRKASQCCFGGDLTKMKGKSTFQEQAVFPPR